MAGIGIIALAVYVFVSLLIFVFFIWSIVWSYSDAERRGKSGCLVAILVAFLMWPLGLVIWLIFRPEGKRRR